MVPCGSEALRPSVSNLNDPSSTRALSTLCAMDEQLPQDQASQWAPPTTEPVARARRGWAGYVVVLALVAALLGIWALGGFKEHVRINHPKPGESLDLGPATVMVDRALAKKNYSGGWDIRAYGTCQVHEGTNLDIKATASGGDLFGIAEDIPKRTSSDKTSLWLAPETGKYMGRDYLAPGLDPMDCAFQGQLPDDFDPEHNVLVQFVNLEFRDTSVTQDQDPVWTGGSTYYRYSLPVAVVTEW